MAVVLLGFVDQQILDPASISWDTNKVGGSPVRSSFFLHNI